MARICSDVLQLHKPHGNVNVMYCLTSIREISEAHFLPVSQNPIFNEGLGFNINYIMILIVIQTVIM